MASPLRSLRQRLFRLEVWCALACAWLLVRCTPFAWWRQSVGMIEGEAAKQHPTELSTSARRQAAEIGALVESVADRAIFHPVCLPRAMAGRWLLARRGIEARIAIGSKRSYESLRDGMLFHAWLMVGDEVVTGAAERGQYAAFGGQGSARDVG